MISAELYLDPRKTEKGYPIKIRIRENRKYKYLGLDKYNKTNVLKMTSDLIRRNAQLIEEVEYCNKNKLNLEESLEVFKSGVPDNIEMEIFQLKKRLAELEKQCSVGILEFYDIRIKEKQSLNENAKKYINVKNQISNFLMGKDVPMNRVDYEFLNDFILYKKKSGVNTGGLNTYLSNFRTVYRESQRRKSLNVKQDNPFEGLITKSGNGKIKKELKPEDLKKLFHYEFNRKIHEGNRFIIQRNIDILLFQFAIGGHDFVDIGCLRWENIIDGRIVFKRFKNRSKLNGGRLINNKLNKFALEVIEKYGDKKSERIFSYLPDPLDYEKHNVRTNVVNKSLKTISTTLGLPVELKTKITRYLFNTYANNLLMNPNILEQIQGHVSNSISSGYNFGTNLEIVDDEHKRVLDLIFDE